VASDQRGPISEASCYTSVVHHPIKEQVISKLPTWVWFGGFVLAFIAGMVNVIGLLGFEHQPVSHLTATVSRIAVAGVQHDGVTLATLAGNAGSFFAGAILSGMLIRGSALQLGRHYGLALMLESMLLFAAVVLLRREASIGVLFMCGACGLQNGMAASYSGAIVRTTHMTGIFTDLGIMVGHLLRGSSVDWRRISLCVSLISGFTLGGAAAALVYPRLGANALFIPATITGCVALAYWTYERSRTAVASEEPHAN
jgi:uncharacterized membrane protein YoaK (UPF0700 family)